MTASQTLPQPGVAHQRQHRGREPADDDALERGGRRKEDRRAEGEITGAEDGGEAEEEGDPDHQG